MIESANDGLRFRGCAQRLLRARDLHRIETEVLVNRSLPCCGHREVLPRITIAPVHTNINSVCTHCVDFQSKLPYAPGAQGSQFTHCTWVPQVPRIWAPGRPPTPAAAKQITIYRHRSRKRRGDTQMAGLHVFSNLTSLRHDLQKNIAHFCRLILAFVHTHNQEGKKAVMAGKIAVHRSLSHPRCNARSTGIQPLYPCKGPEFRRKSASELTTGIPQYGPKSRFSGPKSAVTAFL
jgi:hypothetical protein